MCRACIQSEDTVNHIINGCSKFAQKEYKRRYDCVARALHWDLCQIHEIQTTKKWHEHNPKGVVETDNAKVLLDFTEQTDNAIQARRPNIVIHNKGSRMFFTVDVAILGDTRVPQKEVEKIENHNDLER